MPKKKKAPKPEDFLTFLIIVPHEAEKLLEEAQKVGGLYVDLQCFKKQFIKNKLFRNKWMKIMGDGLVKEIVKYEKEKRAKARESKKENERNTANNKTEKSL